jgi:c-di-GMP-binding flagellar brake protein YcgR
MTHEPVNTRMEERKHKRIQYVHTINVKTQSGRSLKLDVLDFSMGGMGLMSRTGFDPGDILEFLSVNVLDGNTRLLELQGEVVHCEEQFQEYVLGVCFL